MSHIGGVTAIPTTITVITATTPITGITATTPGSSYYGNYPDYGYGSRPYARHTWYYCSEPAGYYPYVTQCKTGWQSVPAS